MAANQLSIIVVTWNACAVVRKTLQSIAESCQSLPAEVFVVDNASSDGTPDMVASHFPQFTLLRNDANLGFAKANNQALRRVSGKYVALINSDVTVFPGCLWQLVAHLEQHSSVGMIGPTMMTSNGSVGPSCMREPTLWIWSAHAFGLTHLCERANLHILRPRVTSPQDVDVLNGWFWVVRRSALDQVGMMDERFFMYGEDIEWCGRFRKHGWRVVYYPAAASLHLCEGSSSTDPVRFYVEMQRARLAYWTLCHSAISRSAYLSIAFIHHIVRILGYGVILRFSRLSRPTALLKMKRSVASLSWLLRNAFAPR